MGQNIGTGGRAWGKILGRCEEYTGVIRPIQSGAEVDLPPSYLIFDKFIFDILLIMLTSLPPLEFLTKIMKS